VAKFQKSPSLFLSLSLSSLFSVFKVLSTAILNNNSWLAKRSASLWPTKKGHQRNYQQANMTKTAKKFVPEIDRDRTRQRERERDT